MPAEAHIVAVGGITPIGACAALSCASVRVGLSRTTLHTREDGSTCHAGFVSSLAPDLPRLARMQRLLASALSECALELPGVRELPVWLALPADVAAQDVLKPGAQFGSLVCASVQTIASGHASGLLAVQQAIQALEKGEFELACVVGVDVRSDEASLSALEQRGQLLLDDNPWGIVPSEAAGAVVIATERACKQLQLRSLGRVRAVASDLETAGQRGVPCIGQGLSRACHAVLDALPGAETVGEIYCDLNGERKRVDDWGYTAPRILGRCRDIADAIMPALQWGDIGHASGPLLLQLPLAAFSRGYARGSRALVWAASEEGARAALLIESSDAPKQALRMPGHSRPPAQRQQDADLVEELLSDACFLFAQRMYLRTQRELCPEHNSAAVEACERRLEAHVDALEVAYTLALPQCVEAGDEAGAVYVALRLRLAQGTLGELLTSLRALDLEQADIFAAAHAALAHGPGPHAAALVQGLCATNVPPLLRALGLWLSGNLGLVPPEKRWETLAQEGPALLGDSFPWALGWSGTASDTHLLIPWLDSEHPSEQLAAARAYLRLERPSARAYLWGSRGRPGYLVPLALIVEPSEHGALIDAAIPFTDDPNACLALGLLGTVEAMNLLLERLDAHPGAAAAASALYLITGHAALEEVVHEIRTDDEALSDEELEARLIGDTSVGVEHERMRRFACTRAGWQEPCAAHARRFAGGQRARLGMPLSVTSNLAAITNPMLAPAVQRLCVEELSLRFAVAARLSSEPRCMDQQRLAAALRPHTGALS